jgi:hypothetical protein
MKITLQITEDKSTRNVRIEEVEFTNAVGRQCFSHPDCYIFLKGCDNERVSYNLMLALQERHMSVMGLRRIPR